ncbi:hypothetical protein [Actinomadura sp. GTD37]|uniref:SecDF P1 head subdomain-containing protein n=1 Tax=Actinomadura sp. GTD37 TaxID=1778030 RepID=UPI0035C23274
MPPGPPPGTPPRLPPSRGPGPLVFVLVAAAAVTVVVLIVGVVAYAVIGRADDPAARAASGPVDLTEPLTFKLVAEVSEHPCAAGALTAGANASCYTFGPDELTVRRLERIKAAAPDPASGGTGWSVQMTLTSADASGFADLTGKAAQAYARQEPAGRMGMLVGGLLISEPAQVTQPITGGEVQISGGADTFTRAHTENLVHRMIGK